MSHRRLFIPGPTEVAPDVLAAMARPMIGHRGSEFSALYRSVTGKLARLLETKRPVYLATGSATLVMEAALRNGVARRCLSLVNGAFSERWHGIAKECGLECDAQNAEWGKANDPAALDQALATGKYDAVTVVHSETSTGVLNPLEAIARVVRKYDDVLLLVDAVSVMAAKRIPFDELGLDVVLAGIQKAFACPPGLVVFAASERAMARSRVVKNKGHYMDFLAYDASHAKGETVTTPAISQMYALDLSMDKLAAEGFDRVYARHAEMSGIGTAWAKDRLALFPDPAHVTPTLTCAKVPDGFDMAGLMTHMKGKGVELGGGYGKLKSSTFRVAHMGIATPAILNEVLGWIDEFLRKKK